MFSNLLQYEQTIGQGSLSHPQDVKLTTDKVVVLDRSPNCIHFFSRSGDLLSSCVSQGEDQGCLVWNPFFFCLDCEQNILVSDLVHHDIKILSNSGELLHTIGREGNGKGEFKSPNGIAISNSGICLYTLIILIIVYNCSNKYDYFVYVIVIKGLSRYLLLLIKVDTE